MTSQDSHDVLNGASVLVVDDNPDNLKYMASLLEKAGCRVFVATDGTRALERSKTTRPDIVLLDVLMPDIDGFEVCRRLKEHAATRDTPVLFMTALEEADHKVRAFEVGAVDFITKPIDEGELRARVEAHVRLHRLAEDLERQNESLRVSREELEEANRKAIEFNRELEHTVAQRTQQLQESESRLRATFDSMDDLVFSLDRNGVFTDYFQPNHREGLYAEPEQFLGKRHRDILPPNVSAAIDDALCELWTSGQTQTVEYSLQMADTEHWFSARVSPRMGPGHTVVAAVAVVRDVTSTRRAQEEADAANQQLAATNQQLEAANQQLQAAYEQLSADSHALSMFRTMIDHSTDCIFVVDGTSTCIRDCNGRVDQELGYAPEELRDRPLRELATDEPPGGWQALFTKLRQTGQYILDTQLRRRDDTRLAVEMALSYIQLESDQAILAVARSVSERRRAEEELRRADRLESLGVLASGIAHDFNNMLGGLFGHMDMIREYGTLDDESKGYLEEALSSYDRAISLTGQLLTFSRGGEPVLRPGTIEPCVRNALSLALSGSNVACTTDIAPEAPAVMIDEAQMGQVLNNMILNARQSMPEGGTIVVKVSAQYLSTGQVPPLAQGEYLKLTIADEGEGIDPLKLGQIFDPFYTTREFGSGLGLAVSYSIVRKHGGHITATSQPSQGTTFTIYLPACTKAAEVSTTPLRQKREQRTGRVLVLDDDPHIRRIAGSMLKALGFTATITDDSEEAVRLVRDAVDTGGNYALAILDLTMPGGKGGEEVVKEITAIDPNMKAIVSTGYTDNPSILEPEQHNFDGVLMKPYRVADLAHAIDSVLGN